MVTIIKEPPRLIVGVDSHKDTYQAAVLDVNGALLGNESFAASSAGYHELEAWLATLGAIDRVGMECTVSYAAGCGGELIRGAWAVESPTAITGVCVRVVN